jgi:DNA helicase-2/ATP-dependent DNA helicase PcrA
MSMECLLAELNSSQRIAASIPSQHALILAGAGTGKTKTVTAPCWVSHSQWDPCASNTDHDVHSASCK